MSSIAMRNARRLHAQSSERQDHRNTNRVVVPSQIVINTSNPQSKTCQDEGNGRQNSCDNDKDWSNVGVRRLRLRRTCHSK